MVQPAVQPTARPSRLASGALATLFVLAERAPVVLRLVRPLAVRLTVILSPQVRHATAANGQRIFGRPLSRREARSFARRVVGNFYDAIVDIGRSRSATAEQLRARIAEVDGDDIFRACRRAQRGAVLVTAHMGSFEVGLAALTALDPIVHVVFKRDPFPAFERIRQTLRDRLGVRGAAIDDGWQTLMQLRTALEANEVVVLQADRAMPGQRFQCVPVCGGHLRLPVGPVTLARIVGSPIVPVFCIRDGDRFRIHLLDAIDVSDASGPGALESAMHAIGQAIERFVSRHPDQWLVLEPAFVEDRPGEGGAVPER